MPVENLGFVAMGGWDIFLVIVGVLIVLFIPGYFLTLALFPKKDELEETERIAMALPLGLMPIFLLTVLDLTVGLRFSFLVNVIAILFVCLVSAYFFYKRGGKHRLLDRIFGGFFR